MALRAPNVGKASMSVRQPTRAGIALSGLGGKLANAQLQRRAASGRECIGSSKLQMNFVVEGVLRVLSCFPYVLPMMDSLAYGRFLFQRVPFLQTIFMTPLQPAFPMLSFVSFLGLFLFVVRNKKMPRFVRFNTMQALLLEIILIFPQILTSSNLGGMIPYMFTEMVSNMTFYSVVSIVAYSCFCNIKGDLPCKIPVISTAVFQQIGGGAGFDD